MDSYPAWALRHPHAARELAALLTPPVQAVTGDPGSEALVQSQIRLEAAGRDCMLFRNNNVALMDETGRLVRAGVANESKQLSERMKSSDLCGWRRVLIGPQHVGTVIAQTLWREVKAPGWRLTAGDKRGQAQAAWIALVLANGGDAAFATGVGTL